MDISEQCGYTIAQQAALFHSIKPLFSNKPLMIVANKTDVTPLTSLSQADTALLADMVQAAATASNGGEALQASVFATLPWPLSLLLCPAIAPDLTLILQAGTVLAAGQLATAKTCVLV